MHTRHTPNNTDQHHSGNGQKGGRHVRVATDAGLPATQLLSNGHYQVMLTQAGAGYSHWQASALTRWREDATRDHWGTFFYVREPDKNNYWSTTLQPTCLDGASYQADFLDGSARFDSRVADVATRVDVVIDGHDDIELRRLTITNHSHVAKTLDLTSYAEIVLANAASDDAHPAFSKLFVQTEILADRQAIVCHRRSGGASPPQPWFFHMVVADEPAALSYETDRMRFIGRGRSTANPQAMHDPAALTGTQGSVLDPVAAIRCPFTLDAGRSITFTYLFGVGDSREACLTAIDKYRQPSSIADSFAGAADHFIRSLGTLGISGQQAALYGRLADSILYVNAALRADSAIIARNERGQSDLWGFSVSGDLPIVLLLLGQDIDSDVVGDAIKAHAYWRRQGLKTDLVMLNAQGIEGRQAAQDHVESLARELGQSALIDQPAGIFIRLQTSPAPQDLILFQAVARIVLSDQGGGLAEQLDRRAVAYDSQRHAGQGAAIAPPGDEPAANIDPASNPDPVRKPDARADADIAPGSSRQAQMPLQFDNGLGGFSADGTEYIIRLESGQTTPLPWVNILANPQFGTLVSESGCANTWSENAQEFLLSPWSNDPVSDSHGEAFYLRDDESGAYWSPTPWPCRGQGRYVCTHGFGYSRFTHTQDGIDTELTFYVALDASIKFAALKISNKSNRRRCLSATGYVEWVLGDQRGKTMAHIRTHIDKDSGAAVARNPYSMDFGNRLAFFAVDDPSRTVTCDRLEFLGRNGSAAQPVAMDGDAFSGRAGAALDPCAALRVPLALEPGQQRELIFMLGAGTSHDDIRTLIERYQAPEAAHEALSCVCDYWTQTVQAVTVDTPDPALNRLANGWLVYQVIACRLWARTAFYQASGAFGFRDQLQDVMALVHTRPGLVREQILLAASRQYPEGDVQHWWHPPSGRGVRTRCSDDYLWLPLATCRYVNTTGDTGILDEPVHFLAGRPLQPHEESYYELPDTSQDTATLYEHGVRAIKNGLRFGAHGLPLMGIGDWNDGMNKVGAQGKGESVWLAFFLHHVLTEFVKFADRRDDREFAQQSREAADRLAGHIEQHGWDGDWFRRAYFDDGSPLGSAGNSECRIDSIAQSWSVLSGVADTKRARAAMHSMDRHLVDDQGQVIKLLAPPFDTSLPDPGYIKAYVPGVRENGGQYTHAAVWAIMAFAQLGDTKRTSELLAMINPVNHGRDAESAARYKVEPYVLASDVYGLAPHTGRGGWTWYSGSAGWLYRLMLESVLGLQRLGDKLYIQPCIPADWETYKMTYRHGTSVYSITVHQQAGEPVRPQLSVDGVIQEPAVISLIDDGREHDVQLRLALST